MMDELPASLRLSLDDLIADLVHARHQRDLGRLALLCYCELRNWARMAGEDDLAHHCGALFTHRVPPSRESFLRQVDAVVAELGAISQRCGCPVPRHPAARGAQRHSAGSAVANGGTYAISSVPTKIASIAGSTDTAT